MFTGNPPLGREMRLRAYRSHTLFNGAIECRLLRFHLNADAVEPDPEDARRARLESARERPGAAMFANRLKKNYARLSKWAKRADVACFRVYDADMPEYAFAMDIYGNDSRWVCVQEYAGAADRVARGGPVAPRRGAVGAGGGARSAAGARAPARAAPAEGRRAVREGRRGSGVSRGARGAITASWSISPITSTRGCSSIIA